jgi:flavin-dependent dehydrogenase
MNFDVGIIGGGPAGCAAALTLRARGHSVVVLDPLRHSPKPTETAVPGLATLLCTLGATDALAACEPCYGFTSNWGRSAPVFRSSLVDPAGHAWFIHRRRFEAVLHDLVRKAGATWLITRAQAVETHSDTVSIFTTNESRASLCVRWILVATGSPSWPARHCGSRVDTFDALLAIWALLQAPLDERLLHVEATDDGWWYVCPADGGASIACFVTDATTARNGAAPRVAIWNAMFGDTQLSRKFSRQTRASALRVVSLDVSAINQCCGDLWVTAGDAAARLDPLGSAGMLTALASGRRAALAISEALKGNAAATAAYKRASARFIAEFVHERAKHYMIESQRRPTGFWARRLGRSLDPVSKAAS